MSNTFRYDEKLKVDASDVLNTIKTLTILMSKNPENKVIKTHSIQLLDLLKKIVEKTKLTKEQRVWGCALP